MLKFLVFIALHPIFLLVHFIFRFKIGWINTKVLGHFVFDTDVNASRAELMGFRPVFVGTSKEVINEFILDLLKQSFSITFNPLLTIYLKACQSINPKSVVLLNMNVSASDGWQIDDKTSIIKFNQDVHQEYVNKIYHPRVKSTRGIIGFTLRDNAFDQFLKRNDNIENFAIRNVDASYYQQVIELCIELDYLTIRIDKFTNHPINMTHDSFYDYSKESDKSEIHDILNCKILDMCFSTGLGIDNVVRANRRDVLLTDIYNPVDIHITSLNKILLPKIFRDQKTGSPLTKMDIESLPLFRMKDSRSFSIEGVVLEQNPSATLVRLAELYLSGPRRDSIFEGTAQSWYESLLRKNGIYPRDNKTPKMCPLWINLEV